jgi:hypothetical protein
MIAMDSPHKAVNDAQKFYTKKFNINGSEPSKTRQVFPSAPPAATTLPLKKIFFKKKFFFVPFLMSLVSLW